MVSHRGPEFAELLRDCVEGFQWALQTRNDVLLFPSSGTGALEAAVTNLLSPGEEVLFCTMGWFGEMWARMARAFGARVIQVSAPLGSAIDPSDVNDALTAHPKVTKVFVTHNETSTAVTNDLAAIATVVKGRGHLLVVDSVSGAGCLPLPVDALGLDVVVTSSQKGWLAPPGLSMVAVSPDAFVASREARCPRWYFDFLVQKTNQEAGRTHTTPPISVMYAVQEGLRMMREEGLANIWARHRRVAHMVREGVSCTGLQLLAERASASDTVTAVRTPFPTSEEMEGFLTDLRLRHGLVLAEGYPPLHGTVFRIGHLGGVVDGDIHALLLALEAGLATRGLLAVPGASLRAARALSDDFRSSSSDVTDRLETNPPERLDMEVVR